MSDEEIVEVIAEAMVAGSGAGGALAALRANGFDLYRPEDCERITTYETDRGGEAYYSDPAGDYRLVPVAAAQKLEGRVGL